MYTKTVDKQLIKKQVTYIFVKTAQMRKLNLSSSKVEDILNEYLDKQISIWADSKPVEVFRVNNDRFIVELQFVDVIDDYQKAKAIKQATINWGNTYVLKIKDMQNVDRVEDPFKRRFTEPRMLNIDPFTKMDIQELC